MPSASWHAKAGRAIVTALPVANLYRVFAASAAHRHHRLEDAPGDGRIGFGLVLGGDHERERFAALERRAAVQAQAWDAADGDIDRQRVSGNKDGRYESCPMARVVSRCCGLAAAV